MNLRYGADPEFFICDKREFAIPPVFFKKEHGIKPIRDDKKHPVYLENKKTGVKVIQDGVAFEVNLTPSVTPKVFHKKMQSALDLLHEFASRFNYEVVVKSTVKFNPDRFYNETDDEEIRQCVIFGCDKDRDAFNSEYISPELDVSTFPLRFGGGHLHLSGSSFFEKYPLPATRLLAIFAGNYFIAHSKMEEEDRKRAEYYGSPGKFRIQKYGNIFGVEYRSLANYWTVHMDMIEGIFFWAKEAIKVLENPKLGNKIMNEFIERTISAMSVVDIRLAKENLTLLDKLI